MNTYLFLGILSILFSCNKQSISPTNKENLIDTKGSFAAGDTVTQLGNNIMVIYQDKKDDYWFGSWEDGLYHYNGKIIIHYTTNSGLPHNRVEDIKEDESGNLYFATTNGISKFNGQNFTTLPLAQWGNDWILKPTDLWFKNYKSGQSVLRYDGQYLHPLTLPTTQLGDDYAAKNPNIQTSPYDVYSIYKDSQGNIWFGTAAMGVCRFNGLQIEWILEDDVTELHNGPSNGVRSMVEDKDGYFWFNAMYRYQVYGHNSTAFYKREPGIGSLDGKPDSDLKEFLSITKDNMNNIWIATYRDGVWMYDGNKIVHYPVQSGSKNITVFCIYKDNSGDLWLGTHENGAYKFNGQTFERFKG